MKNNIEKITLIIPYYNHPLFLINQIKIWNNYSNFIKKNVEIIVVDDCSEVSILDLPNLPNLPCNLHIYRILENKYWNEKGARNLGAKLSSYNFLLHTDFDHYFDNDQLEKILKFKKENNIIYRFNRKLYGEYYKQHKETHIIDKFSFFECGGFDEDFTGFWGGGAYMFYFNCLKKLGKKIINTDFYINTVQRDKYPDCQVIENHDSTEGHNIRKIKEKNNMMPKFNDMIRFNWEKVL